MPVAGSDCGLERTGSRLSLRPRTVDGQRGPPIRTLALGLMAPHILPPKLTVRNSALAEELAGQINITTLRKTFNMTSIDGTRKITLQLTKEQIEFLEWAAKLEGLTPEQYLLKAAGGRVIKPNGTKV
jgi:hypothetical protein